MIDPAKDLFGQIDALLEKRGSEVLSDRGVSTDDFPTLTEVIEQEAVAGAWNGVERRGPTSDPDGRRSNERRVLQRRVSSGLDSGAVLSSVGESATIMELQALGLDRLFELQQKRIEEMVRRVVREELAAINRNKS